MQREVQGHEACKDDVSACFLFFLCFDGASGDPPTAQQWGAIVVFCV